MKVLKSPCLACENNEDRLVCSCTCEKLRKYRQEQKFEKPIFSEEEDLIAPRSLTRSWLMMWEAVWGSPILTHYPHSEEEGTNYRF